jgi:hypothetical protein
VIWVIGDRVLQLAVMRSITIIFSSYMSSRVTSLDKGFLGLELIMVIWIRDYRLYNLYVLGVIRFLGRKD